MRLVRNTTPDGKCKYSLIENEKFKRVEHGLPGTENEFFVLKLKDINAKAALIAYANEAASNGDAELGREVLELAQRAGIDHPHCKMPD